MNCYRKVIELSGLDTGYYQGEAGQRRLLLEVCADNEDAHPTADTDTNPFREVLRRLSKYSTFPAYRDLAVWIGTRVN
jgi:hypothetical protein